LGSGDSDANREKLARQLRIFAQASRTIAKHDIETLSTTEACLATLAVAKRTNPMTDLLARDMSRMEFEEMAQQTRVANFLNSQIGSAGGFGGTAVTTTRNFGTLKWDLAGQETDKTPTDLLAMIVADTMYRETGYTTKYLTASTTKATAANLIKYFQYAEDEATVIKLTA